MNNLFQLDTATILGLAINLLASLGGALLSRAHWPQWITGVCTLLVSSVIGFLTQWSQSADINHYNWLKMAELSLVGFLIAVGGGYKGLWEGTQLHASVLAFPRPSTAEHSA
jgi:uncharacterized membrane protein YfcA